MAPPQWPAQPLPGYMVTLPLHAPPTLLSAVGYRGEAQYVALSWTPYGDELVIYDGTTQVVGGGNTHAWVAFLDHHLTRAILRGYDLGSSESEARHWLVVDRQSMRMSIALPTDATTLLRSQPSTLHMLTDGMSDEQIIALINRITPGPPTAQELLHAMRQAQAAQAQMIQWLDQRYREVLATRHEATDAQHRAAGLSDQIRNNATAAPEGLTHEDDHESGPRPGDDPTLPDID